MSAQNRLGLTRDGKVCYTLRKPWPRADGASVLRFEPVEFLRRLSVLIPPPYAHTIRYFGLFEPNAKDRDLLPAAPVSWTGIRPEAFIRAGELPASVDPPSMPALQSGAGSSASHPTLSASTDRGAEPKSHASAKGPSTGEQEDGPSRPCSPLSTQHVEASESFQKTESPAIEPVRSRATRKRLP